MIKINFFNNLTLKETSPDTSMNVETTYNRKSAFMNFFKRISFPVLSGFLLWLAWPPHVFAPLLFIAFVPLLIFADQVKDEYNAGSKIFKNAYLAFFIWNTLCLYWIYNAGQELGILGALGIVAVPLLLGSLLMSLAFFLYHRIRIQFNETIGLVAMVCGWLCYEYLHQEWQLAFPWMTLGNGFAEFYQWVQWYEFTGVFGGSLWILLINILIYRIYKVYNLSDRKKEYRNTALWLLTFTAVPLGLSYSIYYNYKEIQNPANVVVVQPNVDPFTEKFNNMPPEQQLNRMIRLSDSLGQPNTEFFIWPETAIINPVYEDQLPNDQNVRIIQGFLSKYKNANVITGATTVKIYNEKASSTARLSKQTGQYYDVYNSAMQIENSPEVQVYHKSKLVPGVESYPYGEYLGFLGNLVIDLGGTTGGFGKVNKNPVLYSQSGIGVAPAVCYESVFGAFIADHVRQGAQLICIITNDGWWKNTSGYKQHASYAKLRAIETRRSIARSANTGISSFINQRGDILQQTGWWVQTAIKADLNLNSKLTFYSRYGDYIPLFAYVIAVSFIILAIVNKFLNKRFKSL